MPRFRFRLESLLTARRHVERQHQRAVAELEAERRALEGRLRAQQQFIVAGKRSLGADLVGSLDTGALRGHAGATLRLMKQANQIVLDLAGVHKRLDAARAELIEATRRRRAVELLRERRFAEWRQEESRREDRDLDEIVNRRFTGGVEETP